MKKLIAAASIITVFIIFSCNNPREHTANPGNDSLSTGIKANPDRPDNNVDNPRALTMDSAYREGAVLVANHPCKTCHAIDKKLIGPSFKQVADKYTNDAGMRDELAHKIVYGGYGRWGQVRMPAQNVSLADANQMANYILSLKTK